MWGRPVAVHGGFLYKGFLSCRPVGCTSTSLHRAHGRTPSTFRLYQVRVPGRLVALLCIEHPTTTSRIALLAAVCRREAFVCFMPHHSAPQVAGWMIHILRALVRINNNNESHCPVGGCLQT
jgi:hypothetical protein